MSIRVAVVGAGPAGLAVVETLLIRADADDVPVAIAWLERSVRPDAMLRYGPAAGAEVLRGVAARLDAVLRDPRVQFVGGVDVGVDLSWDDVRAACTHVVRATGGVADAPLAVPGAGAVGIGTFTYLRACAAGSPDTFGPAVDPRVDSAVVLAPNAAEAKDLLAGVPRVELLHGAEPIALVGRSRVRAVRVGERGADGRLRIRDLRAQLVLRPHDPTAATPAPADELVAGWAGRDPVAGGSHAEDAAAVADVVFASSLCADSAVEHRSDADHRGPTALSEHWNGWGDAGPGSWSAVTEVETLLARFAGEGTLPLADYDALLAEADDD